MIQFNLLPDVKLEYIKAQRATRMVLVSAILVTGVAFGLLLLILSANGLQKKHLSDLNKDIASNSAKLQGQKDVGRILTVQNQLDRLTGLHDAKPASSRIFGYLNQVTPAQVSISSFSADLTLQTATITGTAGSLADVNKYVDTLKYTKYKTEGAEGDAAKAFKDVVMTSFSLSTGKQAAPGQAASYNITLSYDPLLLDIKEKVSLSVPSVVTTRSSDLFQAQAAPAVKEGN